MQQQQEVQVDGSKMEDSSDGVENGKNKDKEGADGSSGEGEVPEESLEDHKREISFQASGIEGNRPGELNDNVGGSKVEGLSDGIENAKNSDILERSDILQMKMENSLLVSSSENKEGANESSEEGEVPEKSSEEHNREISVPASAVEGNSTGELNDNINNEEGIYLEKPNIDEKTSLFVYTEPGINKENQTLRKRRRAPRYFDPPECWLQSDECGEKHSKGRMRKSKKKRKLCFICGNSGHKGKQCKQAKGCFICDTKGHLAIDCPNKNVGMGCASLLCLKCGSTGHHMFSCTNDYNPEDLKAIRCYVCKKFGHLCCIDNTNEGPMIATCYQCGQSGHVGSNCLKVNHAADNLQPLPICPKSRESGHSPRRCIEGTIAKANAEKPAKRKKYHRGGKRKKIKPTPTITTFHSQVNAWWCLPIVAPYYRRPGSNVWLSPQAAAARNQRNADARRLPPHQPTNHHIGTQAINSFAPQTQPPHLTGNSPNGSQISHFSVSQQRQLVLVDGRETLIPSDSLLMSHLPHFLFNSQDRTQLPEHLSLQTENFPQHNHQNVTISLPARITQIPHFLSHHNLTTSLPVMSTQFPHSVDHQIAILLPHQIFNCRPVAHHHNVTTLFPPASTQIPCPLSHQNATISLPPTSTQISHVSRHHNVTSLPATIAQAPHPLNHQTELLFPHEFFNRQPVTQPLHQNTNSQTENPSSR